MCSFNMYVTAIVLAAGRGLRLKSKISKPLIEINSKPIIIYCLNTISQHSNIKDIIVVANSKNSKSIISKIGQYRIGKIKNIVLGGKRRQDSVRNGLKAMNRRTDLVLIHDAVRPFIDKKMVSVLIKKAKRYQAAIVGTPLKATIKKVLDKSIVEKTIDRNNLWEIQTPQVFRKDLILEAYEKYRGVSVSDDASLVEKLGVKVKVVMGSYFNIKITTPEDLILAKAILKTQKAKVKR